MNFKFNLGDVVTDKITGYKGVVTCRSQWLNGCNTYSVKCQKLKDDKPIDSQHFDEPQLELHEDKPVVTENKDTGGPIDAPPTPNRL
jgi:heat shock protein HspQ